MIPVETPKAFAMDDDQETDFGGLIEFLQEAAAEG
jgi:hypothetical protein